MERRDRGRAGAGPGRCPRCSRRSSSCRRRRRARDPGVAAPGAERRGAAARGLPIAAIVYATLGALILRRARNPFGWILLFVGVVTALMFVTSCYAVVGLQGARSLPAAEVVGLVSERLFVPAVMAIGFMLLLFPTGAVPSPSVASGRRDRRGRHRDHDGGIRRHAARGRVARAGRRVGHVREPAGRLVPADLVPGYGRRAERRLDGVACRGGGGAGRALPLGERGAPTADQVGRARGRRVRGRPARPDRRDRCIRRRDGGRHGDRVRRRRSSR